MVCTWQLSKASPALPGDVEGVPGPREPARELGETAWEGSQDQGADNLCEKLIKYVEKPCVKVIQMIKQNGVKVIKVDDNPQVKVLKDDDNS